MSQTPKSQARSQVNRLLGYPDDARLLLVNADDFGMSHAVNAAILRSMREGIVRSTSLMPPMPWSLHAMNMLREHPELSFGVHLTVIRDMPIYRWSPMTCRDKIPSLLDESGEFYTIDHMDTFASRAKLDEVELEFRAQIEAVVSTGLKPDKLDWHCLHNGGRNDIFDLTLRLAKEYGLAVRAADSHVVEPLFAQGLPANEYGLMDSYNMLPIEEKSARYAQRLRDLPVGLSEWAVHPGYGTSEMQGIEPDSWQVRQTDYDFVMSSDAREIIEQEGIILVDYRMIQAIWLQNRR